ncbi:MAG: D-alanyl-D-alanine carboxypeptidase family protein [Oscillospiraceae bacterium]
MKKRLLLSLLMVNLLVSCGQNSNNNITTNPLDEQSNKNNMVASVSVSSFINDTTTTISTTISQPKVVTNLTAESTQIEIHEGNTLPLICSILPENVSQEYSKIQWSSSDDTIASIDENGILTGVQNGICTITATSMNNPEVNLKFTVTVNGTNHNNKFIKATTIVIQTSEFTTTTEVTEPTQPPTEIITEEINYTEPPIQQEQEIIITTEPPIVTEIQPTIIDDILIVNNTYPLPDTYSPPQEQVSGDFGLYSYVQDAFNLMCSDASIDGLNLTINSGYVPFNTQFEKFQSAIDTYGNDYADTILDQAGYSECQTGLSILLNSADETFDGTPEASWIAENCYKYGFIVRYPQGKENFTGRSYRSFQIRYVGVDIATDMYNRNVCLEEYLGL